MTTHTVESTAQTVRSGYLDPAAEPVATIAQDGTAVISQPLRPVTGLPAGSGQLGGE